MKISTKDWKNYIDKLSRLNQEAGDKMSEYVAKHTFADPNIIDYAYGLVTKYGEGSAALSALMYDTIAEMEGKTLPSAEVAPTPEYSEVAKTINGVKKTAKVPESFGSAVNRLVKRTGADTVLQNAQRDGAQFAWVPMGDTCAFCIALASRGWQYASKKALKNGHAEHIHANCDCNYSVRFDEKSTVEGYDPDVYLEMYESAEGDTPKEKINSMRARYRAENKDKINAQKRANYAETNIIKPQYNMKNKKLDVYSSQEIYEMANEANKILSKHLDVDSMWSGKVRIVEENQTWFKDWNCDIVSSYSTAPSIFLHEQIHARSISRCGKDAYNIFCLYQFEEESAVELLTQEICKKENIRIEPSQYDERADVLRKINKKFNLYDNDYDFAIDLIKKQPNQRKDWIFYKISYNSISSYADRQDFLKLWEEVIKDDEYK